MQIPFDKQLYWSSFKQAVLGGIIGLLLIRLIWGELIVDDFIGMSLAIPLVAYTIHIIRLFK